MYNHFSSIIKDKLKLFGRMDSFGWTYIDAFAAEDASSNVIFNFRLSSSANQLNGVSGTYHNAEAAADALVDIP